MNAKNKDAKSESAANFNLYETTEEAQRIANTLKTHRPDFAKSQRLHWSDIMEKQAKTAERERFVTYVVLAITVFSIVIYLLSKGAN